MMGPGVSGQEFGGAGPTLDPAVERLEESEKGEKPPMMRGSITSQGGTGHGDSSCDHSKHMAVKRKGLRR